MKAKEVLNILNCHYTTLRNYRIKGYIKAIKKPSGQYDYNKDDVYAFLGLKLKKRPKKVVSYSRVSTQKQKKDLEAQKQRIYDSCASKGIDIQEQFEDIKSGMNPDRSGFDKMCQQIVQGKIQMVVVENKDRLVRFGFEYFEKFFSYFGTKILVLNNELSNKTYEQELTEDLISIIHYYTMKSYSHRRKLNKLRKELEGEKEQKPKNS